MDGWVYRQLHGQTIVASHRLPKKTKPTPGQADRRKRFRTAQAYAAEGLADPAKRLVYQKLGVERRIRLGFDMAPAQPGAERQYR